MAVVKTQHDPRMLEIVYLTQKLEHARSALLDHQQIQQLKQYRNRLYDMLSFFGGQSAMLHQMSTLQDTHHTLSLDLSRAFEEKQELQLQLVELGQIREALLSRNQQLSFKREYLENELHRQQEEHQALDRELAEKSKMLHKMQAELTYQSAHQEQQEKLIAQQQTHSKRNQQLVLHQTSLTDLHQHELKLIQQQSLGDRRLARSEGIIMRLCKELRLGYRHYEQSQTLIKLASYQQREDEAQRRVDKLRVQELMGRRRVEEGLKRVEGEKKQLQDEIGLMVKLCKVLKVSKQVIEQKVFIARKKRMK